LMDQPHDVAHVDPDNISTKSAKRSKKMLTNLVVYVTL
jgi:hypothetical protein